MVRCKACRRPGYKSYFSIDDGSHYEVICYKCERPEERCQCKRERRIDEKRKTEIRTSL